MYFLNYKKHIIPKYLHFHSTQKNNIVIHLQLHLQLCLYLHLCLRLRLNLYLHLHQKLMNVKEYLSSVMSLTSMMNTIIMMTVMLYTNNRIMLLVMILSIIFQATYKSKSMIMIMMI